jgi:hypothetical protein
MPLSIDKKRIEELLATHSSEYSFAGSLLMQQSGLEIRPEEPVSINGTIYAVPPDLENARKHLIALREKIGPNLLSEEQLRRRLEAIRGTEE